MSELDKRALFRDLKDAFIEFQWRQENPFPLPDITKDEKIDKYRNDNIFHCKVDSMACGVMSIIDKHI